VAIIARRPVQPTNPLRRAKATITITEPISLYPGDSVEYDGDFHFILKNNNQGLTAIQESLTTLIQEWREYRERSMHAEDVKAVVMEAVSAAIKDTPLVQLTPQENLQSELPTDLQLWMGRIEGLLVGQQKQIDILTGMVTALVQLSEIEHHTEPDITLVEGKVEQVEQKRSGNKKSERVEQQIEQVVSMMYTQPDISVREVAKMLGCSIGTAHARITVAKEILWKDR
jgi:hypothetical protein